MTLRVAIGPFDPSDPGSDWPAYQSETLAPDFEIVSFDLSPNSKLFDDHDALVVWSPEYAGHVGTASNAFKVAVVGDWHIVPFEQMPWLKDYDLICADKRGIKRLTELGYPPDKLLYFRQFSFDPRLHYYPDPGAQRGIDVAYMGRDVPVRRPFVKALIEWGKRTGRRVDVEVGYKRGAEAAVYRYAKIAWRFAQRGELPMGVYEAAACGALAVLQHDALPEIGAAHAPIPVYSTSNMRALERFLEAWLDDPVWLQRQAGRQQRWVQWNRPVDHLGWLCWQIKERMDGLAANCARAADAGRPVPGLVASGDVCGNTSDALPVPEVPGPSLSDQRLECVALVPETARKILDIGCGTGGVGWALRQRNPAVAVTGVDAEPRMADLAMQRLTRFVQAGVEVPEDAPLWAALRQYGGYDAILCLDVLEHLFDPWAALRRLRPLLADGGVLVASVPNVRNADTLRKLLVDGAWRYFRHGTMDFRGPSDSVLSWEHLRFFTRGSIEALFRECGYRIEHRVASHFAAPPPDSPQERWRADLRTLVAVHGGNVAELEEALPVIQWILVAKPDWQAVV